jgi:hypothetical protein
MIGLPFVGDWRTPADATVTVKIVLWALTDEGLRLRAMAKTATHRVM